MALAMRKTMERKTPKVHQEFSNFGVYVALSKAFGKPFEYKVTEFDKGENPRIMMMISLEDEELGLSMTVHDQDGKAIVVNEYKDEYLFKTRFDSCVLTHYSMVGMGTKICTVFSYIGNKIAHAKSMMRVTEPGFQMVKTRDILTKKGKFIRFYCLHKDKKPVSEEFCFKYPPFINAGSWESDKMAWGRLDEASYKEALLISIVKGTIVVSQMVMDALK